MEEMRGASFAGSPPTFLGRGRAAIDVDVGPERPSPRYHETCLALESVTESSAAVLEPRCVWLRVPIFKNLEKAVPIERPVLVNLACRLSSRSSSGLPG